MLAGAVRPVLRSQPRVQRGLRRTILRNGNRFIRRISTIVRSLELLFPFPWRFYRANNSEALKAPSCEQRKTQGKQLQLVLLFEFSAVESRNIRSLLNQNRELSGKLVRDRPGFPPMV